MKHSSQHGLTLIELVVGISIASIIIIALALLTTRVSQIPREQTERAAITESSRNTLERISDNLRNAQNIDVNGDGIISGPDIKWLALEGDYEVATYSNVDTDPELERVRYKVEGTEIKRGIIEPVGTTYNPGTEQVTTISTIIRNVDKGVPPFTYIRDSENEVISIRITLVIDADPNQSPGETTIETKVTPRQGQQSIVAEVPPENPNPPPPPVVPKTPKMRGAHGITVVGSYAYIANTIDDAVNIVDISNPANPVVVGYITDDECGSSCELEGAHEIIVSGQYAYVSALIDNGIEILDISDPTNPTHVGSIDNDACGATCYLSQAHGLFLDAANKHLYVTSSSSQGGVEILDVFNPASPTHLGSIINSDCAPGCKLKNAYHIELQGQYAYVTSGTGQALEVLNISNPFAPFHVGVITDQGCAGCELKGPYGLHVVGNYAYVGSYYDDAIEIVDISNPANPTHVGALDDKPCGPTCELDAPHSIYIEGQYAYVTGIFDNGFEIINVSDPANPTHVGSIDDAACGSACALAGAAGIYIDTANNLAYIAGFNDDGLEILNISNLANPTHAGSLFDY